jgi:hypothetical protein
MQIDIDILRQVRETADWFIQLPAKLVAAIMGTRLSYLDRRERISKLKELAVLREMGKVMQELYFFKGDILGWLHNIQSRRLAEDIAHVRGIFDDVIARLDIIWLVMSETPLSDTKLGAEAALEIAKGKRTYKRLRDLPDEVILADHGLLDIFEDINKMMAAGDHLLKMIEEHRQRIDNTYG